MRYTKLFLKTLFSVIAVELGMMLLFEYIGASAVTRIVLDTLVLTLSAAAIIYYFLVRELKTVLTQRESFHNTGETARLVLDSIGEGVYGIDLKGNVIFYNQTAADMLGYAEGILGLHSHELFHHTREDGRPYPAAECPIYATAADGQTRQISDEVFWKKDDAMLPVEYIVTPARENGKITGVIVSFRDVTDRRRTEREIRVLHSTTKIITDAPDFISTLEPVLREICINGGWTAGEAFAVSRDGMRLECAAIWTPEPDKVANFIEVSKKTSFRPGQGLPGRVWTSLEPVWIKDVTLDPNFPRLRAAAQDGLKGAVSVPVLADGKFVLTLDFFARREIEGLTDFQAAFLPTIAAQLGHRFRLKQAADAEKAAQKHLFELQKMESLGRAAGAIAHDFNNILTGTKGFTALALEMLEAEHPAAKHIRQAADGIDRGAALTQQLLAFSRGQASEMQELDLNAVIKGMDAMLNMIFQHRIGLELNLDPDLPPIRGNKGQLEQIIMNLAVNARDAMSGKGRFSITTLADAASSGRSCPADYDVDGHTIRLSVSDTGSGIPEAIINRIFEPLFTTKPEGKGTGMGLATVYALVKAHQGGISVLSKEGQGTTFDICFPAAGKPARK